MKWFEQDIIINDLPTDFHVVLVGHAHDNIVELNVELYQFSSDNKWFITEWSKHVKMWSHSDITNDDIRNKYCDKIVKILKKHEGMPYGEWHPYFMSKGALKV